MAGLISTENLMDYLGVDDDSKVIVMQARVSAISELKYATGVNWETVDDAGLASEAVQILVWMNFYGIRGGAENTIFLQSRLTQIIKKLQYGGG